MGYVHGCKNETNLNSLSSAVCLASAMQRGPPGEGGPHPPADCECRLCITFRKVAGLLFGADTSQVLRDRCRPYIEGLYTQLLEIALEVRGTAASGSGEAGPVGEVRPGGPTPPKPAADPAGDGGERGEPTPTKASPGETGVKKEEEEESSEGGGRKKGKRSHQAKPVTPEALEGEGVTSASSRPELEVEEDEKPVPKGKRLPPLPRQRRGGYDEEDRDRHRRRRGRSRRRRRDRSDSQELHPKAAPSTRRPRTPSRSPPSVHTPEDVSSSAGDTRDPNERFKGTSLEVAEEPPCEETPHTLPAAEESEDDIELPEEEAQLEVPEPDTPPAKGKGKGRGKGFKGKKGKKSKPKKRNKGIKKTWRNIDFYANKRRDPTWRRSAQ